MPFAVMCMDLESQIIQKEKNKYRIMFLICGIKKKGTDELLAKQK